MSGYRSLHRTKVGDYPIWNLETSTTLRKPKPGAPPSWRIWTACGDGIVRGYLIEEKSLELNKDALDASACICTCTHVLLGGKQLQRRQRDDHRLCQRHSEQGSHGEGGSFGACLSVLGDNCIRIQGAQGPRYTFDRVYAPATLTGQIGRTLSASSPLRPGPTSNSTL